MENHDSQKAAVPLEEKRVMCPWQTALPIKVRCGLKNGDDAERFRETYP